MIKIKVMSVFGTRPQAIEARTVRLAGIKKEVIVDIASVLINSEEEYKAMSQATNPYGDRKACERILNII